MSLNDDQQKKKKGYLKKKRNMWLTQGQCETFAQRWISH